MTIGGRVAQALARHGRATCAELAARLGVEPPAVSEALRVLRKAGRVKRAGGNTRGARWRSTPKLGSRGPGK